ncbi:metal-dependent hydrolase [archaeon]|nr:MAG: metal-dependent hydrolase [archaeon]
MEWKSHLAGGLIAAAIGMAVIGGTGPLEMVDAFVLTSFFAVVPCVPDIFSKHFRTPLTHSLFVPLAAFLFISVLAILPTPNLYGLISLEGAFFVALGLASHALLDSFTSAGAPLLYPLVGRRHLHFPWFGARMRYEDGTSHNTLQAVGVIVCAVALLIELIGRLAGAL